MPRNITPVRGVVLAKILLENVLPRGERGLRPVHLLLTCILTCSCVSYIHHDEDLAASAAVKFAKVAFVERDYENARKLLPPEVDQNFDTEKLKQFIEKMHPTHFPAVVTATDYEPLPGTKSLNIYLVGEGNGDRIYYRLTLGGTSATGYKVYTLYSNATPFPPSAQRNQLPNKRSTED